MMTAILSPILGIVLSPLLLGVINRTKAVFAGRHGQPLLQVYFDVWKLLQKGAVYSRSTTWIFRAGPIVSLAATLMALMLIPLGGIASVLSFSGDVIVLAGLLGLVRFFTVLAALDTASSFEGMGASREVQFASLAEPAFYLALAVLVQVTDSYSLSGMSKALGAVDWSSTGFELALATVTLFVVFLVENSRIPFDDPNTHLELTMIHEVMVLDHSGPDLAFITIAAALKHWILGALVVTVAVPAHSGVLWMDIPVFLAGMTCVALACGVVESVMARLRLIRVAQLLVGAGGLSALALILGLMR